MPCCYRLRNTYIAPPHYLFIERNRTKLETFFWRILYFYISVAICNVPSYICIYMLVAKSIYYVFYITYFKYNSQSLAIPSGSFILVLDNVSLIRGCCFFFKGIICTYVPLNTKCWMLQTAECTYIWVSCSTEEFCMCTIIITLKYETCECSNFHF